MTKCPAKYTFFAANDVSFAENRGIRTPLDDALAVNVGFTDGSGGCPHPGGAADGKLEVVFYKAGTAGLCPGRMLKVDRPCLALIVKQGNSTRVPVVSPGGEFPTVHLTIATPQAETRLTFDLPSGDEAGKSRVVDTSVMFSPSARRQ